MTMAKKKEPAKKTPVKKAAEPLAAPGDSDLRVLFDHLSHLKEDISSGDFNHAWTHVWGLLDVFRNAFSGEDVAMRSASVAPCPEVECCEVTEDRKAKALKVVSQIEKELKPHASASRDHDDGEHVGKIDWLSLFMKFLKLLPILIG
jgi:hypothetical protein